jgi:hypothetical protein
MPDSAASKGGPTASQRITAQIAELKDWRGKMLADLRALILAADPDIMEEWKWKTAVRNGLVCAGGAFKDHVKLNFSKARLCKIQRACLTPASMPRLPEPST